MGVGDVCKKGFCPPCLSPFPPSLSLFEVDVSLFASRELHWGSLSLAPWASCWLRVPDGFDLPWLAMGPFLASAIGPFKLGLVNDIANI